MSIIDTSERAEGQARSSSSSPPVHDDSEARAFHELGKNTPYVKRDPARKYTADGLAALNRTPAEMNPGVEEYMDDEDTSQLAPTKQKGRGRGKAAYPKGGENTPASAYTGHKIKHLKKDDGEPLWRKDIQYDFLKEIFMDKQAVFTNSYEPEKPMQTFADLYIDTMARSSKTSKILRDKLLTEHEPAKNMAMVCLLVNLGRMNTTLNCRFNP